MIPWGASEERNEGYVIVQGDSEVHGWYKLLEDEIPDEHKPIPSPEEQREMREKGYPDHYWITAKRNLQPDVTARPQVKSRLDNVVRKVFRLSFMVATGSACCESAP